MSNLGLDILNAADRFLDVWGLGKSVLTGHGWTILTWFILLRRMGMSGRCFAFLLEHCRDAQA